MASRRGPIPSKSFRAALENARLACATGAAPPEILAAALASLGDLSVESALEALAALGPELTRLAEKGAAEVARRGAKLEAELQFQPELSTVRPDLRDHELRGKLLFTDLVGKKSFFQVAAWAIAGLDLGPSDARLLEHLGVNTQLQDARIWPLAVSRRVAVRGGPLARTLVAGSAAMFTRNITIEPVAQFMRFLDEVDAAVGRGSTVDAFVEGETGRGRRIAGFGRPVLGPDERVPHALRLAKRGGRGNGPSVRLAKAVELTLRRTKGLAINSAGVQAAIMRDMGFTPDAAAAFCAIYFVVPMLAQHAFVNERSKTPHSRRKAR